MPGLVPPVADERAGLLAFLAQQREVLRIAAYGLSDEQAAATPTASSLSVGGLIKHASLAEALWIDRVRQHARNLSREEYLATFHFEPAETLASVIHDYDECARRTEAVISVIPDLGEPVPVPSSNASWYPKDVTAWSVRWVLLHLIQETARHAGHADIIRESIDGATAVELMAAAEGWPEAPWVKPWQPAAS